MITISVSLIPLIILGVVILIWFVLKIVDEDLAFLWTFLLIVVFMINVGIYAIMGIVWVAQHLTIVI